MRQARGFTLLEVLIVVTILSAVATIAVPNLLRAIDLRERVRCRTTSILHPRRS